MRMPQVLLGFFLFFAFFPAFAQSGDKEYTDSAIDNSAPRKDEQKNIIDAHEGCLRFFNGKYYWYGVSYGDTEGSGNTNRLVAYSSNDLVTWVNEGPILRPIRRAWYDRPHVIYNSTTNKYIAWYLLIDRVALHFAVAQSDDPLGPFSIIDSDVKLAHRGAAGGDMALFVDDDRRAYIAYTSEGEKRVSADVFRASSPPTGPISYFQMFVEELSSDYLHGTGTSVGPIAGNVEGPAMFKRNDLYYLLFDNTCYWCSAGSGVREYTASKPLGPFTYRGNINRIDQPARGSSSPWTPPGTGRPDAVIKAQQADVTALPAPNGAKTYLWIGDHFHSAPDGIKGHDSQNWAVMSFAPDGMIEKLENRDFWLVPVPVTGSPDSPK
jgi:hypothetical protein